MRLNAFISNTGLCSRRKAATLIKEGRVKVGGKVLREPAYIVRDGDAVSVNGKLLRSQERKRYFLLNKPKGVTTTCEDEHAKKKVTDLISRKPGRIYPVGRLDKDSSGLIVLTNDGDLCYRLTHPKFEVKKEYAVAIEGSLDDAAIKRMKAGVFSEGEMLKVKSYSHMRKTGPNTLLNVVITEGKKRHLRRIFKQLGHPVVDLKRIRIGNIRLGIIGTGAFKEITREEMYSMIQ